MHIFEHGVRRWVIDMVIDSLELESVRGLGRRGRLSMLSCVTAKAVTSRFDFRGPVTYYDFRGPAREGILVPAFSPPFPVHLPAGDESFTVERLRLVTLVSIHTLVRSSNIFAPISASLRYRYM